MSVMKWMAFAQNGRCSNTFGSFMCICNDGYKIDETNAVCVGKLAGISCLTIYLFQF